MTADVFGNQYSDAYDALYGEKDYRSEVALVLRAVELHSAHPARSIVDWGCGTGEHALRFAQHGLTVTGVDLSESMLRTAQRKIADAGLSEKATLKHGNVADVDLGETFDAATMMFAVLGYQVTNDQVLATLRNVRRHLRAGSIFVCDVWYGPAVLTTRPSSRFKVTNHDGRELLRAASTTLDTTRQTATVSFELWAHEGDRVIGSTVEHHTMRFFFPQELVLFLALAGFKLVSLTAFPSLEDEISDTDWNALLVAKAV